MKWSMIEERSLKLFEFLKDLPVFRRYSLVGVEVIGAAHRPTYRVYADRKGGIDIDNCAEISREIAPAFDEYLSGAGNKGAYLLEVSSPGVDRPLFFREDFYAHLRQHLVLRTHEPIEGRRNFKGVLVAVSREKDSIELEVGTDASVLIPFANIKKCNIDFFHE